MLCDKLKQGKQQSYANAILAQATKQLIANSYHAFQHELTRLNRHKASDEINIRKDALKEFLAMLSPSGVPEYVTPTVALHQLQDIVKQFEPLMQSDSQAAKKLDANVSTSDSNSTSFLQEFSLVTLNLTRSNPVRSWCVQRFLRPPTLAGRARLCRSIT